MDEDIKMLRQLLTNFVEINRSKPEVKWIALDDLSKVVESKLSEIDSHSLTTNRKD